MSFLARYARDCWTFWLPLSLFTAVGSALIFLGHSVLGFLVVNGRLLLTLIGNIIYIVLWKSLDRWGNLRAKERLWRLLTFRR